MTDENSQATRWRDDARAWCAGRRWEWRAPLIAYLAFTAARGLTHPMDWSWWSGITFGVHELGHVLFAPFGELLTAAGGSIAQLAAPALVAWSFRRQGDWFGIAVGGTWLGYSLANLATYIGDARAQELPLVGFTDRPEHDWHYLLGRLGWLRYDADLAALTRLAAAIVLAAAVALAAWLCLTMHRARRAGARAANA